MNESGREPARLEGYSNSSGASARPKQYEADHRGAPAAVYAPNGKSAELEPTTDLIS